MLPQMSLPAAARGLVFALLSGTTLGFALPVAAQDAVIIPAELVIEDVGASVRIDYAGRLRLFSQKIAADACFFAAGLDQENAKALLIDAIAQFDQYIVALRVGDESLGILGPEENSRLLREMDALLELWTPFKAAAEAVVAGDNVELNLAFVAEQNMPLLDRAIVLAADVNAFYANPAEMTQANAMLLDIAGRQRMLTQEISKEACGVETGNAAFGTVEQLDASLQTFELSLIALLNGMPDAGIISAPTPELVTSLQAAIEKWAPIKDALIEIENSAGDTPDEALIDVFNRLEDLREDMKQITIQYRDFARLGN